MRLQKVYTELSIVKSIALSFFVAILFQTASAQVERTVIVEHFTNTRCGICAFRNPAFYENLNNQENVFGPRFSAAYEKPYMHWITIAM